MDGVSIPIRNMNFSFGVKKVLVTGHYEKSERELITNTLNLGDQVVEMGGSIGVISAVILSRIGNNGRLVSIEASNELVKISASWLDKFSNLKIVEGYGFPVLIAPKKYHFSKFITDGNSLGGLIELDSNVNNTSNIFDLRRIQNDFSILPDALVIDIEGSEIVFVEEDVVLPSQIKIIIIELHPHLYGTEKMNKIIEAIVKFEFQLKK